MLEWETPKLKSGYPHPCYRAGSGNANTGCDRWRYPNKSGSELLVSARGLAGLGLQGVIPRFAGT